MDERASIRAEGDKLSELKIAEGTLALTERVIDIVAGVLRNQNPIVELRDGVASIDLDLGALDRIFIADALERAWPIELNEDEIDSWQTMDDIVISVRNRIS
jgi:acyl carrier protein